VHGFKMNGKPPTKGASHVAFPFQHQLMTNVLPNIVEKIENIYSTLTCFMHYLHNFFDLWMSCDGHQTFAMVVKSITNL